MHLQTFAPCTITTNQLRCLWQLVNLSNDWLQYILFLAAFSCQQGEIAYLYCTTAEF